MVQILQRPSAGANAANALGEGLQQLLQHKLSEMQSSRQQSFFEKAGLNPTFAKLSEPLQKIYLQQALQEPSRQNELAIASQFLPGIFGANQNAPQQAEMGNGIPTAESTTTGASNAFSGINQKAGLPAGKGLDFAKFASQIQQQGKANEIAEDKLNYQRSKGYIEDIEQRGKSVHDRINTNEQIIDLLKTGKVNTGPWRRVLDRVGLGSIFNGKLDDAAIALMNRETADWVRKGGRSISDSDARLIQSINPSIYQQPEGIAYLASNNILGAKLDKKEDQIRAQIIQKNKNRIPNNLRDQVEERMKPEREKYSQSLKRNLGKLVNLPLPNPRQYEAKTTITHPVTNVSLVLVDDPIKGKRWAAIGE